ncbi:MAG TPA: hypothetical protein VGH89_23210 [Pseudonocardia sp.]|jgi:hypothetical protein
MLAVAVLVVAGFVALSGRAEAAPLWRVGSDDYDCSGTLNSLMISHPGTTWIREGNYLVLLSDYGGNIRVPCTAPGQLTSLGPPVGVWESAPGILQPPSAYPGQ